MFKWQNPGMEVSIRNYDCAYEIEAMSARSDPRIYHNIAISEILT